MPKSASRPNRPFSPRRKNYNKMQGQGRRFVSKFYKSRAWIRLRNEFLMHYPICAHCEEKGIITPANTVDHIKQINQKDAYDTQGGRYGDPLDWDNLQALCPQCHNIKSAKERWGKSK